MAREVLVVVLSLPTGQGNTDRSEDDSYKLLEETVEWADGERPNMLDPPALSSGEFDTIVVAPEYYFIDRHPTDRLPLDEVAAIRLQARLLGLSARHHRILIVPGTIFYSERMNSEKVVKAKANALAAEFAARRRAGPAARDATVKPSDLFGTRKPKNRGLKRPDAPAGPHVVDVRGVPGTATSQAELQSLELGDASDSYWGTKKGLPNIVTGLRADSRRARNRAYLLLAGEVHGMYDKHSDFFEVGKAPDRYFFIPGTRELCPEIGGYRFGVEICADHRLGVVKRNTTALDFQIVLSDFIEIIPRNIVVRDGGVYIHASSSPASSAVVVRGSNKLYRKMKFKTAGTKAVVVDV